MRSLIQDHIAEIKESQKSPSSVWFEGRWYYKNNPDDMVELEKLFCDDCTYETTATGKSFLIQSCDKHQTEVSNGNDN